MAIIFDRVANFYQRDSLPHLTLQEKRDFRVHWQFSKQIFRPNLLQTKNSGLEPLFDLSFAAESEEEDLKLADADLLVVERIYQY